MRGEARLSEPHHQEEVIDAARASRCTFLVLAALLAVHPAWAAPLTLPVDAPYAHLGVASCAGTSCHGAAQPMANSSVRQNEFLVWEREDPHAKAYKSLSSAAGKRIAANLGLASSTGPECLGCHSDAVASQRQGKRYKLSEGIGCEACHGGAEKWLGPHMTGTVSYDDMVAVGMYPLVEPAARATLCLSCHQGDARNPLTHRLLGAGHPPVNGFELDTYTATQPAHFRVDADYRKRKPVASSARTWVSGQMVQAANLLAGLQSPRFAQHGLLPELAFYDCDSCHHTMQPPRWMPGVGGPLGPGELRLDDVALTMTGQILAVLQPLKAKDWQAQLDALRKAGAESPAAVKAPAQALQSQIDALLPLLSLQEPKAEQSLQLAQRLLRDALERGAGSYTLAAQTAMALAVLTHDAERPPPGLKPALDGLFKATQDRGRYDPTAFQAALKGVEPQLAQLR